MVINYADIFERIHRDISLQNWYTPEWESSADGALVRLYKQNWDREQKEIFFECFGRGEDPEQQPVIIRLVMRSDGDDLEQDMDDLEERVGDDLQPLIGFEVVKDEDVFMSKELPSDPLTLHPRVLEEFTKLQSIAFRIDQMLGDAPQDFTQAVQANT